MAIADAHQPHRLRVMPMQKVAHLLEQLGQLGVSQQSLLAQTDIAPHTLYAANAWVTQQQSLALIHNALRLSPRTDLGLLLGSRSTPSTCGLMGYAMSCAPDTISAAEIAIRYQRASPTLATLSLVRQGDTVILRATTDYLMGNLTGAPVSNAPDNSRSNATAFVIEELFSATLEILASLTGHRLHPQQARFAYDTPPHAARYREVFHCPAHFNAPLNELIFDARHMAIPTIAGNPVSASMAQRLCEQYLQERYLQEQRLQDQHQQTAAGADDLPQQIRHILLSAPGQFPDAAQTATQLGLNARTLRRRLRAHQTSFQAIFDSARSQLAHEYLHNTALSLEDIAPLVGFSDASNFRRAFRRWTGKAPSDIRRAEPDTRQAPLPQ